jgi:hypothetical protein
MAGLVNFAISHFGVRLFPQDEEGTDASDHGNLTIWEHSLKDIKQWVTSESGDYFAYIVEKTRVYVKCKYSSRIQELFEEYLVFHDERYGNSFSRSASVTDNSTLAATGVAAPHVRRSSVVRLRDSTQERAALAAIIEEEKKHEHGDTLRDGWEEFFSEEHEKFYYFNARTDSTTWDRSEAYYPSAPTTKSKSMLHDAAIGAASIADLKDMSEQLRTSWMESLVSVGIPRTDSIKYSDIFMKHNMDFASLITLTEPRMNAINIVEHHSEILELRAIATQLPSNDSNYHHLPEEDKLSQLSQAPKITRRDSDMSKGWSKLIETGTGRAYFWNGETGDTRWDLPPGINIKDVPSVVDDEETKKEEVVTTKKKKKKKKKK